MSNRYFADISNWTPRFDAKAYADAGHIAIAIKATEGTGFIDPDHKTWSTIAHLHHLSVIHYHFARPDTGESSIAEADHFLNTIGHSWSGRDFAVLDLERATPAGWTHDPAWSAGFDEHCISRGQTGLILYASRSVLQQSDRWLINRPKRVWDAAYGTEPTYAPPGYSSAFRQYTDGHVGPEPRSFAGIGPCDGNRIDPALFARMMQAAKCQC